MVRPSILLPVESRVYTMDTAYSTCCTKLWPLEILSLHIYLHHRRKIALYGCRYTNIFSVD